MEMFKRFNPGHPLYVFKYRRIKNLGANYGEMMAGLRKGEDLFGIYIIPSSARRIIIQLIDPGVFSYFFDKVKEGKLDLVRYFAVKRHWPGEDYYEGILSCDCVLDLYSQEELEYEIDEGATVWGTMRSFFLKIFKAIRS